MPRNHRVLARTVATGLRRQSMAVDLAASGDEADRMCLLTDYDVLILDRDLPVMSGDEVCRRLRELADPPRILMLTAAGGTEDIIEYPKEGVLRYLKGSAALAEHGW